MIHSYEPYYIVAAVYTGVRRHRPRHAFAFRARACIDRASGWIAAKCDSQNTSQLDTTHPAAVLHVTGLPSRVARLYSWRVYRDSLRVKHNTVPLPHTLLPHAPLPHAPLSLSLPNKKCGVDMCVGLSFVPTISSEFILLVERAAREAACAGA